MNREKPPWIPVTISRQATGLSQTGRRKRGLCGRVRFPSPALCCDSERSRTSTGAASWSQVWISAFQPNRRSRRPPIQRSAFRTPKSQPPVKATTASRFQA